jgi:pentatricopeptide repeat protein
MTEKCVPANVTTYNALLKGLQYKNMAEKAFEIMERMRNERCMPDYVVGGDFLGDPQNLENK